VETGGKIRTAMQGSLSSRLLGNILFALVIIGVGTLIFASSRRIEYVWRWERVPDYIISSVRENFNARANGILISDGDAVYIIKSDGKKELVSEKAKLLMSEGSQVLVGDLVAVNKSLRLGPLTKGLLITLEISFFSIIIAVFIGIITGLMRISPVYVFRKLALTYVEIVRGTPLLVQIFILYFFFGKIFNMGQFASGVAALAIFTGAYIAEIVRAGIQSVHKGQTEAARSLGLNYIQTMQHIILPQALRRTLPPMAGQFISLIKDSSLVSVIAITDLTKAGREVISATFSTFEVWFTVAAMYLILTSSMSYLISRFELHMAKAD
jgi:polar amino acid transport system permease protein